ncbi:MAG: hypothetical protein AMJ78_07795 [Omnitrophica WOR_2 bacterium SM23_29]|nr:MAG: hypothetical protein AMJ78_07795 [Omnitrophica WOR_2 bacterium SM23_29]
MESIGSQLKHAREVRGVSIEQAQKDTRIHARILRALEEDRIDEAASTPLYIKSFIRKYADYLGLDGKSLADEYFKEHPKLSEEVFTLKGKEAPVKFPPRRLVSIVVSVLVIILGITALVFIGSRSRPNLKQTKKASKTIPLSTKLPIATKIRKGEDLLLTIKTRSDVWLKVTSDGTVVYEDILKRGSQENWQAKKSLEISTSRAEALNAELNGEKLGPLGEGVVQTILIGKDGLKLPR